MSDARRRYGSAPLSHGPRKSPAENPEGLIWGIHAVAAALANRRREIRALHLTDNAAQRLAGVVAERGVQPERAAPRDLDRRLGADTVHQGALLETSPLPAGDPMILAGDALERGPLLVLDQLTDPHNVGAILRSAAVLGAAGLVMPRRHSPPLGGALAKAASGALEIVPVALVQNLARTLGELTSAGVVTIGLAGDASDLIEDVLLWNRGRAAPVALVLGAEGKGLRQLTRERCDRLCRIAGTGPLGSLNVSNAAAVALHLAAMARRKRSGADH